MKFEPIGLNPRLPLTGTRLESNSASANDQAALAGAKFKRIYMEYPRHVEFHARCDFLIKIGLELRGSPQTGMRGLGPSNSGKSTAAEAFIRKYEAAWPRTEQFVPIVYIVLERVSTTKKLMMSILAFFGDDYSGSEFALTRRVYACFERLGTRLLIIDEVQHLSLSRHHHTDVTDSLKRILDAGIVPILFLGTMDAIGLFTSNVQLASRLQPPQDFDPLDRERSTDRALFKGYLSSLDRAIVEAGLMPLPAGLANTWIRGCLHEATKGVVGLASRIVAFALEIAIRRGAEAIEVFDLALAVDRFAVPLLVQENPFRARDGGRAVGGEA